jgi:hypothetical protein
MATGAVFNCQGAGENQGIEEFVPGNQEYENPQ